MNFTPVIICLGFVQMTSAVLLLGSSESGNAKSNVTPCPTDKGIAVRISAPPALMFSAEPRWTLSMVTGMKLGFLGCFLRSSCANFSSKLRTLRCCSSEIESNRPQIMLSNSRNRALGTGASGCMVEILIASRLVSCSLVVVTAGPRAYKQLTDRVSGKGLHRATRKRV